MPASTFTLIFLFGLTMTLGIFANDNRNSKGQSLQNINFRTAQLHPYVYSDEELNMLGRNRRQIGETSSTVTSNQPGSMDGDQTTSVFSTQGGTNMPRSTERATTSDFSNQGGTDMPRSTERPTTSDFSNQGGTNMPRSTERPTTSDFTTQGGTNTPRNTEPPTTPVRETAVSTQGVTTRQSISNDEEANNPPERKGFWSSMSDAISSKAKRVHDALDSVGKRISDSVQTAAENIKNKFNNIFNG